MRDVFHKSDDELGKGKNGGNIQITHMSEIYQDRCMSDRGWPTDPAVFIYKTGRSNNEYAEYDAYYQSPYRGLGLLEGAVGLIAPDFREELGIGQGSEDERVQRKSQVVEPHSGVWSRRIAEGVFMTNNWRVEEENRVDEVAEETENIEGEVRRGDTDRRPPTGVLEKLRVERERPKNKIRDRKSVV